MPLLLQLLFWYNAVLKALPDVRDSRRLPGGALPQQPRPVPAAARYSAPASARSRIALLVGIAATVFLSPLGAPRQKRTGEQAPVGLVALGAGASALPLVACARIGRAA